MSKQVPERRNVACHESTTLMMDNNHPDIPGTSCKMGQIAPNFEVLNRDSRTGASDDRVNLNVTPEETPSSSHDSTSNVGRAMRMDDSL